MATKNSFELFKYGASELPAYIKFLKSHKIEPGRVKSIKDFKQIPITSKSNYLRAYSFADLCRQDQLNQTLLFCSTSGSTGEPYYFPRGEELSQQYSVIIEDFLNRGKTDKTDKILVIIGFGMGIWIGGVITLRAFEIAGSKSKASISILPTGYNKVEIFKALQQLAPEFDQTIIIGYPPFVKELVDEAKRNRIKLKDLNLRFLFAAETFTETFRDYICKAAHVGNPLTDTINIYGTADIGAMAYETPLSILIRRLSTKRKKLFEVIFGQIEKTPTLAQYNPDFIEFEEVGGEIILTADSALPLIRYGVGDHGGVISYSQMSKLFLQEGLNLEDEIKKAGLKGQVKKQPFVYVYERKDFSITLHGINIYPEFIKEALLDKDLVDSISERFTMITKYDENHDQYIEINLELQPRAIPTVELEDTSSTTIVRKLIEKSSEFAEISNTRNPKKLLKIVFWPNGHPRYFVSGIKQKWVLQE